MKSWLRQFREIKGVSAVWLINLFDRALLKRDASNGQAAAKWKPALFTGCVYSVFQEGGL